LGGDLVGSTGSFCSAEARDDVKAFFAEHKVPDSEHALKHAVESINGCIELRKLQGPNLDKWMAAQPGIECVAMLSAVNLGAPEPALSGVEGSRF
jgi:Mlc titration factor MtfA (ptsG expression regulator)